VLGLHCEHASKYKKSKKHDVPEARRKRESKRIECPFRVNIRYNNELGMVYISKAALTHNHNVLEPSEDHARFFHTLSEEEDAMIQRFATLGGTRTQVLKVIACLYVF
jgi:hypothetical protein